MNRSLKLVPLTVLLTWGLLIDVSFGQFSQNDSLTELIAKVEASVVRIDVNGAEGEGIGSGFVVDPAGIIVTNHHVIAGAMSAEVTFRDKKKVHILGTLALDRQRDLAVVKIDAGSYRALKLAQALPRKGESVTAFGSPVGLSFTATEGIISAIRTSEELREYVLDTAGTWIQTSTPISPGNSGGPLVNRVGEVVGANTMTMVQAQNLNFAISSIDIADVLAKSRKNSVVPLADGAAKAKQDSPMSRLSGKQKAEAIDKLTELLLVVDADSTAAREAAAMLILVDPDDIDDPLLKKKVAKSFKRLAFESDFLAEVGVRGMVRWGGDYCIPYFVELLELENLGGNEAIYTALSESKDPRASEAIARRLGNFFDHKRAWAALRRMGPAAEPGLILAVSSSDPDVSLGSIQLLSRYGTEASLSILNEAQRKGIGAVRVQAKQAAAKIRARMRKAALKAKSE